MNSMAAHPPEMTGFSVQLSDGAVYPSRGGENAVHKKDDARLRLLYPCCTETILRTGGSVATASVEFPADRSTLKAVSPER
jgi:hypothetical protein